MTTSTPTLQAPWKKFNPPAELAAILERAPKVLLASSIEEMVAKSFTNDSEEFHSIDYTLPDGRVVTEATVARVRNGIVVNYPEPYMRRRDPNTMLIGDDKPSDKPRFRDRFGSDFGPLRTETQDWLAGQELALVAFHAGKDGMGVDALAVVPANAMFFGCALALLQGFIPPEEISASFDPRAIIYVAPPFRHTHFKGKQIVVHHRGETLHEMFCYNLYPGPSAKKGVYGVLIDLGEVEGWITAHCSTVRVVTPYDNEVVIMHEGASGGGKSEMLEYPHRLSDGRLHFGRNLMTGEDRHLEISRGCKLEPVVDDMAQCHSSLQEDDGKLTLVDAEHGWFVRVNHINEYGTDLDLERLTAQPPTPLVFMNIDAVPRSRALIWEHIEDSPGNPCPNPRVIIPRSIIPNIVNEPVKVDVRTFGVRTPPCTRAHPSYGIFGLFHLLPPSLAWLWRLVAPRGHGNPSIIDTEGMVSEGVGSYWPFATGRRVDQANLLLKQFRECSRVRYCLIPNQHVGAWKVGFMPNWLTREYLARRGMAKFRPDQITPSRCPLLGYSLYSMQIEGRAIARWFLEVNTQPEVGDEGFDAGAAILSGFFHKEIRKFLGPELDPLGRDIIQACLDGAKVEDYMKFISSRVL